MDKTNKRLKASQDFSRSHRTISDDALREGQTKTAPSPSKAPIIWSPTELLGFQRVLSALSVIELVSLFRKDTTMCTRLLRMVLRVSFPNDNSLTPVTVHKLVLSIRELVQSSSERDSETKRRLLEVIVDIMDWCIKHKAPVSLELWQCNLVALKGLAVIYRSQNQLNRARLILEKAVQFELKSPSTKDRVLSVTAAYNDLALLCAELEDWDGALHQYQQSLQFQQETLDVDHPLIIATLHSMARLYLRCNMYHDTLSLFHHILILQDTSGIDLLETTSTLSSMGLVFYLLKDYTNALHNYHEALTMLLRHYGGDCGYQPVNHHDIAMTLNSIGMIHCEVGSHDEARSYFHKSLSMHLALAAGQPDSLRNQSAMSAVLHNTASVYLQKGEDDIALGIFRKSIHIKKTVFAGRSRDELVANLQKLGNIHLERGEHKVAILYFEEALNLMLKETSSESSTAALSHQMIVLGNLYLRDGNVQRMMLCLVEASCRMGSLDQVYEMFDQTGFSMLEAYSLSRTHPPSAGAA